MFSSKNAFFMSKRLRFCEFWHCAEFSKIYPLTSKGIFDAFRLFLPCEGILPFGFLELNDFKYYFSLIIPLMLRIYTIRYQTSIFSQLFVLDPRCDEMFSTKNVLTILSEVFRT